MFDIIRASINRDMPHIHYLNEPSDTIHSPLPSAFNPTYCTTPPCPDTFSLPICASVTCCKGSTYIYCSLPISSLLLCLYLCLYSYSITLFLIHISLFCLLFSVSDSYFYHVIPISVFLYTYLLSLLLFLHSPLFLIVTLNLYFYIPYFTA